MTAVRSAWMFFVIFIAMAGLSAQADDMLLPRAVIPFTGTLDLKALTAKVTFGVEEPQEGGVLILEIARPVSGRYDLKADMRHVMTPWGDAACILNGRLDLTGVGPLDQELVAEVSTRYTLLNYKPVRDVYLKFALRDQHLTVEPFWFGALSGRGQVSLVAPYDLDVAIDLLSLDLEELWPVLRRQGIRTPSCSGVMTGALTLQGPWGKPMVTGHGAVYNGQWKDFAYETISLRFEGAYPLIRIKDGRVASSNGPSFSIEGAVDLDDLARLEAQVQQFKHEIIVTDDAGGDARAFRLNVSDGHATRLKSFLSGNADGRNQGERIIGLEKQIGF